MPVFVVPATSLAKSILGDRARMKHAMVEAIRTTVKLHGPRIAQAYVSSETPPPVDRGTYRRSFKVQDITDGVVIYNFAPHAGVIERGRRPGRMPPIDVIQAWVRRKHIGATFTGPVQRSVSVRSKLGGRKKSVGGRKGAIEAQQRNIAFRIARKIGARGLPAHHILDRTVETLTPIVEKKIAEELGRV